MNKRNKIMGKILEYSCRTCAKCFNEKSTLTSIFEENASNDCKFLIIHELILLQVNVEEDDGLPQQICIDCIKQLRNICTFRELCKKSYKTLKDQFLATTVSKKVVSNSDASSNSGQIKLEIEEKTLQDDNVSDHYKNDDDIFEENNYDDDDDFSNFSDFFPDKKSLRSKTNVSIERKNLDVNTSDNDEIDTLNIKSTILEVLESLEKSELDISKRKPKSDIKKKIQSDDDDDSDFDDDGSNFSDDLPLVRKKPKMMSSEKKEKISQVKKVVKEHKKKSEKKLLKNTDTVEQCKDCNKYCTITTLKSHKISCANLLQAEQHFSVEKSDFHCFYCEEKFDSKEIITDHILNTHPKNRPFQCTFCKEHFPNLRQRNTHIEIHNGSNFAVCQICKKGFRAKANLKKHMLINHTTNNQHECKICFKIYNTTVQFKRHLQAHDEKLENMDDNDSNETIYKCDLCIKEFKNEIYYKRHMETHESAVTFNCTVCGKGFQNQKTLKEHKNVHSDIFQYQCEFCGKQFRTLSTLNGHVSLHIDQKSGNGPYSSYRKKIYYYNCPKCPRRFRVLSAFERHIKMHSEDRPYPCTECNNAYIKSEHLKRHIDKVHLKNRKFACRLCTSTFMDAYTRNNHERVMHKNIGQRFSCKYCHKVFKNEKNFKLHEGGHVGIKNFKCYICPESFQDISSLKVHLTKHTPEEHDALKAKILAENPIK